MIRWPIFDNATIAFLFLHEVSKSILRMYSWTLDRPFEGHKSQKVKSRFVDIGDNKWFIGEALFANQ